MPPERWQQVSALFTSALDVEPDARSRLLGEACAGDDELKREVEALLASHDAGDGFLAQPPFGLSAFHTGAAAIHGQRIGRYTVLRELGEGGMGAVYLAVRADDEYEKQVAIKLLRAGMDTEAIVNRFRHERQILASLDHPHIAKLLDGGTTETGLPYFVMEYIDGQPLDEYCDRKTLALKDRLLIFRQVCSAVQYAHRHLVVHRDIKPRNILVTAEGLPSLLDFGISKVLHRGDGSDMTAMTVTGVRPLTPDYASPEQVRGEPITTASDIYSLGVVLYELLTGHRPYRFKTGTAQEIERVICEHEPAKPSSSDHGPLDTSADRHAAVRARHLKGDLDNIVLMALRKEPTRRYLSVEQFSEDLQRHLDGLPVLARQDTLVYRATKFAGRHRLGVAAAALAALLMVGFTAYTQVQATRVARERDRAETVSAFMVEVFTSNDPDTTRGNTVTAREVLDRGAAKIATELQDQPDVQAALMDTIGQAYHSIGLYENALALLHQSLQRRRQFFGSGSEEVAESLLHLASVQQAKADYGGTDKSLNESLSIRRRLHGDRSPQVVQVLRQLVWLKQEQKEYGEATMFARQEVDTCRALYGSSHSEVARSLRDLASSLLGSGDARGAEAHATEAVAMNRALRPPPDADTLESLMVLARVLIKGTRDHKAAMAIAGEAVSLSRQVYGTEHSKVSAALHIQGSLYADQNDFRRLLSNTLEELRVNRRLYGTDHPSVARDLNNIAQSHFYLNDLGSAEVHWNEALALRKRALGAEHPHVTWIISNLGLLKYEQEDYAASEALFRESLRIQRKNMPDKHAQIGFSLVGLGRTLLAQGRASEAEKLAQEGVTILRDSDERNSWAVADAESVWGGCLLALHRYKEAEPILVQSFPRIKNGEGGLQKRTDEARQRMIRLYEGLGQPDQADRLARR